MSELLRIYARKRLEDAGGPPELHPATRRLLQAEAAKLRPRPNAGRWTGWTWLLAHWPRVAISAGLFAALGLVVWNILPDKEHSLSPMMLAQEKRSFDAPAPTRQLATAPVDKLGLRTEQSRDGSKQTVEKKKPVSERFESGSSQSLHSRAPAADSDRVLKDKGKLAVLSQNDPASNPPALGYEAANDAPASGHLAIGGGFGGMLSGKDAAPSTERPMTLANSSTAGTAPAGKELEEFRKPAVLLARQDAPRSTHGETLAPAATPPPAPLAPSPAVRLKMASAPPTPSAPTTAKPVDSFTESQTGATRRYRFNRQSGVDNLVASKKEIAPTAPLSTFQFEQTGDEVRVTDVDGSVYAGRLLSPDDQSKARPAEFDSIDKQLDAQTAKSRQPVNIGTAQRASDQSGTGRARANIVFRVTGTNRTSGQIIILEGTLTDIVGAREWPASNPSGAPAPAFSPAQPALRPPSIVSAGVATTPGNDPQSRRLVGRLRVGASDEVIILAVPAAK